MDYDKALLKAMKYCSVREATTKDIVMLLARHKVNEEDVKRIVEYLINHKFIDNTRYATAYIRDKMRLGNWGKAKIVNALMAKGLARRDIEELCEELIDDNAMRDKLNEELRKKLRTVKSRDKYDLKNKLMRFALSRGFNSEEAIQVVNRICDTDE